jgi:hypothetical protein
VRGKPRPPSKVDLPSDSLLATLPRSKTAGGRRVYGAGGIRPDVARAVPVGGQTPRAVGGESEERMLACPDARLEPSSAGPERSEGLMRIQRYIRFMILASALLASGCANDQPTQPATYALSGHVELVGHLTGANGQSLGTRVVTDADGVPVDLLYGSTVVAHTLTSDGAFRFTGIAPGGYFARASIFGSLTVRSAGVTIASRDVEVADPILLESVGDLYPVPNPSDSSTVVTFASASFSSALLRVLALDGAQVRRLYVTESPGPGLYSTVWDGEDDSGVPVAPGYYWMTLAAGTDQRAQLLFR